jgi:hypothetical protein
LSNEKQINVTVFTAYQHARGGDLVAACLYMQAMIKQEPNIKITWVVKRDIEGFATNIEQYLENMPKDRIELICIDSNDYKTRSIEELTALSAEELYLISENNWNTKVANSEGGWPELQQKFKKEPDFAEKIKSTHLFCAVPNLHRFVDRDREFFSELGIPFIAISEYDNVPHVNNKLPARKFVRDRQLPLPYVRRYLTGFSEGALGVYVDEVMEITDKLAEIPECDTTLKNYLLQKTDQLLFYGYFFVKPFGVKVPKAENSLIDIKNYINLAIKIGLNNPGNKQDIDIVLPITNKAILSQLLKEIMATLSDQDKNNIKTLKLAQLAGNDFEEEEIMSLNNNGTKNIRFINPLKIHRKTVQCLLNQADSLCGLTGDQSWIEGLVKGKLTCYQIMKWKAGFFKAFLCFLATASEFGEDSLIYKFYSKQLSDKENAFSEFYDFYMTADQEQLKAQAMLLAKIIKDNKNLLKKEIFEQFIIKAKQSKQLLLSYRQQLQSHIVDKPKLETLDTKLDPGLEKKLYDDVYDKYQAIQFVKTIRFDDSDFNGEFILRMTEQLAKQQGFTLENIRMPIRWEELKALYKVTCEGVKLIGEDQQYTLEQKQGYSKKQSFSVVSIANSLYTRLFGFTRGDDLTGVILFSSDLTRDDHFLAPDYINVKDAGTVGKPWYFSNREEAQEYYDTKFTDQNTRARYKTVEELINYCVANKIDNYNEILLRAKWIPGDPRCHLAVFSQNLMAKIIVQFRAVDWKIYTNQNFIPISFYIPDRTDSLKFFPYLLEEQEKDLQLALTASDPKIKAMGLIVDCFNFNKFLNFSEQDEEVKQQIYTLLFSDKKLTHTTKLALITKLFKNTGYVLQEEDRLNYINNNKEYFHLIFDLLPEELKKSFCNDFLKQNQGSLNFNLLIKFSENMLEYLFRENLLILSEDALQFSKKKLFEDLQALKNEQSRITFIRKFKNFLLYSKVNKSLMQLSNLVEIIGFFDNYENKVEVFNSLISTVSNDFIRIDDLIEIINLFEKNSDKFNIFRLLLNRFSKALRFYDDTYKLLKTIILTCANEDQKIEVFKMVLIEAGNLIKNLVFKNLLELVVSSFQIEDNKLEVLKLLLTQVQYATKFYFSDFFDVVNSFQKEDNKLAAIELLLPKLNNLSGLLKSYNLSSFGNLLNDENKVKVVKLILNNNNNLDLRDLFGLIEVFKKDDDKLKIIRFWLDNINDRNNYFIDISLLIKIIDNIQQDDNKLKIVKLFLDAFNKYYTEKGEFNLLETIKLFNDDLYKLEFVKLFLGAFNKYYTEEGGVFNLLETIELFNDDLYKLEFVKLFLGAFNKYYTEEGGVLYLLNTIKNFNNDEYKLKIFRLISCGVDDDSYKNFFNGYNEYYLFEFIKNFQEDNKIKFFELLLNNDIVNSQYMFETIDLARLTDCFKQKDNKVEVCRLMLNKAHASNGYSQFLEKIIKFFESQGQANILPELISKLEYNKKDDSDQKSKPITKAFPRMS